MDENNGKLRQHSDLPETHRYASISRIRNESAPSCDPTGSGAIKKITSEAIMTCQNSPAVKRKLQVTIDPSAFVKPGICTPLCKRKLDGPGMIMRDKNSGSFPNTPQALRRAEIAQGMLSVSNSPVVSRRSELISDSVSIHSSSPLISRRSEILFQGESASSSAASSPLLNRKAFGSPARSIGEPGVFSSPAHSIIIDDDCEEMDFSEVPTDQTIVAGWLKFRDNKRWKQRWGVATKLSPAAGKLNAFISHYHSVYIHMHIR
ncbi:uncharacterized protein LOC143910867 [Arctopsyche grandis]|uniref:uncharacterized protein LOC143910867 n=1 Tax=Arctopsyche grandis TaxID=121162 RepID=UPI00406D82B7